MLFGFIAFRGMTPEQAELNFLDNVRKLPMYGVHRHLALVSFLERSQLCGPAEVSLFLRAKNTLKITLSIKNTL